MRISVIGNGRLGKSLALGLRSSGHLIVEIYSRNTENLDAFCQKHNFNKISDLCDLNPQVDLLLVSVTDTALLSVLQNIEGDFVVAHTSGSISLEVFQNTSLKNYGVFYPLYSFSNEPITLFQDIPILIEANNAYALQLLNATTKNFSNQVTFCNSSDRESLHLVAVFVNNFTNYLLGEAQDLTKELDVDINLLIPILKQTVSRLEANINIANFQSGPAVRNDEIVIQKHLKMLDNFPRKQKLYALLTKMIQNKISSDKI